MGLLKPPDEQAGSPPAWTGELGLSFWAETNYFHYSASEEVSEDSTHYSSLRELEEWIIT